MEAAELGQEHLWHSEGVPSPAGDSLGVQGWCHLLHRLSGKEPRSW